MPFSLYDGDSAYIKGGSDDTLIGNVSDRLKVTALSELAESIQTFVVYAEDVATATNKSMVSIVNTSGSTVRVRIREIRIINTRITGATGVPTDLRLLRIVGHSAGTSLTPSPHDTVDVLDSSITARTGATVTSEGTAILRRWLISTDEWGSGAADSESASHDMQMSNPLYYNVANAKPLTLNANEGFTIKNVTATTTGLFDIVVVFTQET